METIEYKNIVSHFLVQGTVSDVKPVGNGLINDTLKVSTAEEDVPDYILQRINNAVFTDVELLQHNIEVATDHIREKLRRQGVTDLDRHVLRFIPTREGKTYYLDENGRYWRVSVFVDHARNLETVDEHTSYKAGQAFGNFEAQLSDVTETLGETIPDFHNMELRVRQLREAVDEDPKGRVKEVRDIIDELARDADAMCLAEQLHREGRLPKRLCHCDSKVNNMMFAEDSDDVLCILDLDTVMPSFVYSDYGDFLRSGANTVAEDDPNIDAVEFRMDIFRAYTEGYIEGTRSFLTPTEREGLPYAAARFPYMQCIRFLADYLNGDTYYKIRYPEHNLVRTRNQLQLYRSVRAHEPEMKQFIEQLG